MHIVAKEDCLRSVEEDCQCLNHELKELIAEEAEGIVDTLHAQGCPYGKIADMFYAYAVDAVSELAANRHFGTKYDYYQSRTRKELLEQLYCEANSGLRKDGEPAR